jgi:uncharacterized protein
MSMFPQSRPFETEYRTGERSTFSFFNAVYAWMAVGLAVTALVAFVVSRSPEMLKAIYGGGRGMAVVFALGAAALGLGAQHAALRISAGVGMALYLAYAAVLGALLSGIFLVYPTPTLAAAFFVTGGVFAVMSVYGFVTKRDLSTIGSYLMMGVIGLFVASIVNIFLTSDVISWFITYAVLAVFIGIAAWKTQELRDLAVQNADNATTLGRLQVYGSIILYITFINLFLSILRILGDRR